MIIRKTLHVLVPAIAVFVAAQAYANTLNQNVSWTVDRSGTSTKYRIVAYGDSIYAGYNGSISNAARYSAPTVESEYLSAAWRTDVESIRRAKSGAGASDVYQNKIVAEKSYMQASSTRVVTFEMCGNDGLQARTAFKDQTGTCNSNVLETAVQNCKTYVAASMDFINANAYPGVKLKVISNLYYPGYNADNVQSSCNDPSTGTKVNLRDKFLVAMSRMNYWMCEYARQKGFACADSFATSLARANRATSRASRPPCVRPCVMRIPTSPRPPAASTTSSPMTCTRPTPAGRSRQASGAAPPAAARRVTPATPMAAARSGTSMATSAWAGCCRSGARPRPDRR